MRKTTASAFSRKWMGAAVFFILRGISRRNIWKRGGSAYEKILQEAIGRDDSGCFGHDRLLRLRVGAEQRERRTDGSTQAGSTGASEEAEAAADGERTVVTIARDFDSTNLDPVMTANNVDIWVLNMMVEDWSPAPMTGRRLFRPWRIPGRCRRTV